MLASSKKLETPVRPPRRSGQKKSLGKVLLLPKPRDMDDLELREMAKSRPVVKSKINEWYDWLANNVPKSIRKPVNSAFLGVKNRLYGGVKEKLGLKDQVDEQAEEEHGEENVERAMNDAYKSFRLDGRGKTDVDSYIALVTPPVHELQQQVGVLKASKMQMHLWIMWKKDSDGAYYTLWEKAFTSMMTEVF